MRIIVMILALLLALPVLAQRDAKAQYERVVNGSIEIASDGSVHAYKFDKGISAALDPILDKNIRGWKFEPILVDGRPVLATTRMQITLQAVPVGDDYGFRIARTTFGAPSYKGMRTPPSYPRDAARAGLGANVTLVLKLDADGHVVAAHAEQVSLNAKAPNENTAEKWRRKFEQASLNAARHWTYEMTEVVDGHAIGTSVRVPVQYFMGRDGQQQWQGFIPGPRRPAPWVGESSVASESADRLRDGDVQALDSRFKLKSDVVGTVL